MNIGENFVKPISSIANVEYDYLIIATINPSYYNDIKKELSLVGVDQKKIVKINTDITEISKLLLQLGFGADFKFKMLIHFIKN